MTLPLCEETLNQQIWTSGCLVLRKLVLHAFGGREFSVVLDVNAVLGKNEVRTNVVDGHYCRCAEIYFTDYNAERKLQSELLDR